jgi:hypothetical protein
MGMAVDEAPESAVGRFPFFGWCGLVRPKRVLVVIVVALLWSALCALAQREEEEDIALRSDTDYQAVSSAVSRAEIEETIAFMSECGAQTGDACRITGSPGCEEAERYVRRRFEDLFGAENVKTEEFTVVVPVDEGSTLTILSGSGGSAPLATYRIYALWPNLVRTSQTPPGGIAGPLVYGGGSTLAEYSGQDVDGAIVLLRLNCGTQWFNAPLLGAKAVLFIEPERTLRGEVESKFLSIPADIPRFWVPKEVSDSLLALLKARGTVRVRVDCKMRWKKVTARNILGTIEGSDPRLKRQHVVIQSYYDSISFVPRLAPGAENACGIAALLQVAKGMKVQRPKRTVQFLATPGHFQGLAGVKNFVYKRFRGARTEKRVAHLFDLARQARRKLEEAQEKVWEREKTFDEEEQERETPEQRTYEQMVGLRRVDKALAATRKLIGKMAATVRKAKHEYREAWAAATPEEGAEKYNQGKDEEKWITPYEFVRYKDFITMMERAVPPALAACDELERVLRQTHPLRRKGAELGEQQQALQSVQTALVGVTDALDFSEYDIYAFFGIDLSSHFSTTGIFYKGYGFDANENIQWKFSDIGKKAREYSELIGSALAVTPASALVDGINPIQGKNWRVYLPGKLAMDHEIVTLSGRPGIGFATINDARPYVDTPFDIFENVEVENVYRQTRFIACLIADLVNVTEPKKLYELDLEDNLCEVRGRLVEFDPRESYFPDTTVPGAIAVARTGVKTCMGVRSEVFDLVDEEGRMSLKGLPNARAKGGAIPIEGYLLDPETGAVVYAPDQGVNGAKAYAINTTMDALEKAVTCVMFPCTSMAIYDMVDQRFFALLQEINVYDARTDAEPYEFGYCMPLPPQQWVSYYEPVAVIFATPGTNVKVTMGASVLGLRFTLLNSQAVEDNDLYLGTGYPIDKYPSLAMTPFYVVKDMWNLNEIRIQKLRRYGIENARTTEAHKTAKQYLDAATAALEQQHYDDFFTAVRRAWSFATRAYPDAKNTGDDVVKGILFYLALLLPFSFFAERLLVASRNIKGQIIWTLVIFVAVFLVMRLVHPAFRITFAPIIILLAFVILALVAIVVGIVVQKFEEQMKEIKYQQTGIHQADVGRLSASGAAFSLGISNMRRRKARTLLTCSTLILLTFTVLSFTSVVPHVRANKILLPKEAPYNGVLIRDKTWEPLGEPTTRLVVNEYGKRFPVAPRAWYFSAMVGEQSFVDVTRGDQKFSATALVGMTPEEDAITHISDYFVRDTDSRWFEKNDDLVCVIPKGMADKLGIKPQDVGIATVNVFGVSLRVIGMIESSRFKRLKDLDGEQLTPVDYLLMQEQRKQQQQAGQKMSEDDLREYIHLAPDNVLFVPYDFVIGGGGTLRSIAIGLGEAENVQREVDNLMQRVELNLFSGEGGRTYLCSAVGVTSFGGMKDVAVPILIAALIVLNTMLGSVYERTNEIGIYSSLGLAPVHIASLFVAESCVYAILGAIAGYLVGQSGSWLIYNVSWLREHLAGLNLNYSSLSAVVTTIIVMATVLLSTIYPARKASQIAVPGVERRWRLPDPVDDKIMMQLPFTVTGDQALGVNMFLKEYLEAHADYSLGHFSTGDVTLAEEQTERGKGIDLSLMVWLAPYDLGVSERLTLRTVPSEDEDVFEIHVVIARESGDESSWLRVTRNFVNMLRKQYLLWRTFRPELKAEYGQRGRGLISVGDSH